MYEPIPTWTLGDRLRKIRRDNADGITQKAFAESIAFSGAAVAKWERMDHTPRSARRIINAVELRFGLPAAQFLRDPQPTGCRPRHLSLVPQLSEVA